MHMHTHTLIRTHTHTHTHTYTCTCTHPHTQAHIQTSTHNRFNKQGTCLVLKNSIFCGTELHKKPNLCTVQTFSMMSQDDCHVNCSSWRKPPLNHWDKHCFSDLSSSSSSYWPAALVNLLLITSCNSYCNIITLSTIKTMNFEGLNFCGLGNQDNLVDLYFRDIV